MNGYAQSHGLITDEVSQINRSNEDANQLNNLFIKDIQDKNQALIATNIHLNSNIQELRMQMRTLPTNFVEDWKLVFDCFVCNTKPANLSTMVGGCLEESAIQNSSDICRHTSNLGIMAGNLATGQSLSIRG
jgi:hypothetical protein